MKIWFKIWENGHMLRDYTVADESGDTRTHKVFGALKEACYEFDLMQPIWLDATVAEFKRYARARFTKDCFVEEIPFDYMEIHVIEED